MGKKRIVHLSLTFLIASVWIINGLFCKVLDFAPRHEQIVSRILGPEYSEVLTKAIGIAEIFMAVWIISRIWSRLSAVTQIVIVVLMNAIEFVLAPDLLLFGRFNFVIALAFIGVVYYNECVLNEELT